MDRKSESQDCGSLSSIPGKDMAFETQINAKASRFPHCVVWTPLPIIT